MGSSQIEATMKGVNNLKNEVSAWEMRLEGIKSEIQGLTVRRDAIQKDIEEKKNVHNQEIDRKNDVLRKQASEIAAEKDLLKVQKDEFKEILVNFQKEKNAFETEKTKTLDMKANYEKMNEKAGQFLMLVKRAAESL